MGEPDKFEVRGPNRDERWNIVLVQWKGNVRHVILQPGEYATEALAQDEAARRQEAITPT